MCLGRVCWGVGRDVRGLFRALGGKEIILSTLPLTWKPEDKDPS